MQKPGMLHEGLLRQYVRKWNKFGNPGGYGILKGEWNVAANKSVHRASDTTQIHPA